MVVDLKKKGILQDIGELKEKKEKKSSSSYYNPKLEKRKLALMEESYKVKYSPRKAPPEYKKLAQDISKRERSKINEQEAIEKQKKKIYERSFIGRAEGGISRLSEKGYRALQKRVIVRRVLKPSQTTVTIKEREVPSVLNDPNRFFKHELEETKKSLFFS